MSQAWRTAAFATIAAGFYMGALYHGMGLVKPEWAEPAPPWRHALFIAINVACGVGISLRPRWFVYVFACLVAQQLWGHGTYGWRVLQDEGRIDWASVVVVVFMPLILWLLVSDHPERSGGGAGA